MLKKYLVLLPLFLLIHYDALFKFSLSGEALKIVCVYNKNTSSISRSEIVKFLNSFKNSHIDWLSEIKASLKKYDYLVLAKGFLKEEERERILKFLKEGGGLIFFLPYDYNEGFLKKIGLRTYNIYKKNLHKEYNHSLFKAEPRGNFVPYKGVIVKTGYGGKIKEPERGNVFPERIPVRDFIILAGMDDKDNNLVASQILLVKHWQNPWDLEKKIPRKWLLFSCKDINFSKRFYKKISSLIVYPLVIESVNTEYPLYEKNEKVTVNLKVYNSGGGKRAFVICEILFRNKIVYFVSKDIYFARGINKIKIRIPRLFDPGYYVVKVSISENKEVKDYSYNAFIVKNKQMTGVGPSLRIEKGRFLINGRERKLKGVNYYESKMGELMWLEPNIYQVNQDFELMRKMGFNIVRIHYHHPKWFQDYLREISSPMLKYFPHKEYLPSKKDLRVLDSIIYLAQINGLIICLDLFSLLPDEMGDPLGWLSLTERIKNEDKIKAQLEFIKILAQRYKNIPGITWDLWNEPRLPEEEIPHLKKWSQKIIQEFRKNGDRHLITIGGNDSLYLADILDYISIHINTLSHSPIASLPKPVIIQEFWLPAGLDEEINQRKRLQEFLQEVKSTSYQGFMPWGWTRQARLWDASEVEEWDDDLGLFLREDGSLKPCFYLRKYFSISN